MDRINHVKIVTPDPMAIKTFLTEILDIPEGWELGELSPVPDDLDLRSPARDENGEFNHQSVDTFRGAKGGGLIVGDVPSRQFQILEGDHAHIWAVAVGTRHIERALERCQERGIPCTTQGHTPWHVGGLDFFFAEVGGIVFEILRATDK
jgi:catechol 2,3-dioxygenase-like lactoylglutathione lyase family enzyme